METSLIGSGVKHDRLMATFAVCGQASQQITWTRFPISQVHP
jgi:hypothetical protein